MSGKDMPPTRERSTRMQTRAAAIAMTSKRPTVMSAQRTRKGTGNKDRTLRDHIEGLETLLAASGYMVRSLSAGGMSDAAAWRTMTGQSAKKVGGQRWPQAIRASRPREQPHAVEVW